MKTNKFVKAVKDSLPAPVARRAKILAKTVVRNSPGARAQVSAEVARRLHCNPPMPTLALNPTESDSEVRLRLPILGSKVVVVAVKEGRKYIVGAIGDNAAAKRWLNDMLVTRTRLYLDARGRYIHAVGSSIDSDEAIDLFDACVRLVMSTRAAEESASFDPELAVSAYWSAGVVNFGDWAGPNILSRLTGRQPLLPGRAKLKTPVVYSVGSVLGWFDRNNVDVWGSGLMRPFTEAEVASRKKLTGVNIHAVRGKLTQQHLAEQIGWAVPEVYGDPALLLPRLYTPHLANQGKVAFTPHGTHQKYFTQNVRGDVNLVNVRADFRDVVDSIAGARAVVSTSLHGLIVAQAYGTPWIWLRISDHPLWGADFKFDDFFSTLVEDGIAKRDVSVADLPSVDVESLAAEANLPDLAIDLDSLADTIPVSPARDFKGSNLEDRLDSPL